MRRSLLVLGVLLFWAGAAAGVDEVSPPARAASVAPAAVTAQAAEALERMSRLLAGARSLAFQADVTYDVVLGDGQKIQYSSRVEAALRRPGQLRVDVDGDEEKRLFLVDDGSFTFVDLLTSVAATTEVSADLDAAMDDIFLRVGASIPIADLLYSDPFQVLMESALWGRQVGVYDVRGVSCAHLAFTTEGVDWQLWIEEGPKPLPCKFVVDWKHLPGSPTYAATFTHWELDPKLKQGFASFEPSSLAAATEFLQDEQPFEGANQ